LMLDKILDTVCSGSASKLVMHALRNEKTSAQEIDEIKKFIERMEGEENGNV